MPTYEYYCKECEYYFDDFRSIMSDPYSKCLKCNQLISRSVSGGSAVIFKGDGFLCQ